MSRDTLRVDRIDPDPDQPRRHVDEVRLAELAASIRENGQGSPILVRPAGERYVIVHGERRWRAAQSLGWSEIRCEIADLSAEQVRWLQLAENVNRADLSPVEEARAYRALLDTGVSRDTLAGRLGKSRSYVAQKLRLLDLPASLTLLLDRGALSEGHVRQLLRVRGLYTDAHTVGGEPTGDDPEVQSSSVWEWPAGDRVAGAMVLLRAERPEDWPPLYPHFPFGLSADRKQDVLAVDAAWSLHLEMEQSGASYPRWAPTATYFAAMVVWHNMSVADLHTTLDHWIERLHAGVVAVMCLHSSAKPPDPANKLAWLSWWGHRSDLRHAGLLDDHEHLAVDAATAVNAVGSMAAPSGCQARGPHHEDYEAAMAACGWSA